jgi:UDP-3-O-[3-hydroxymyristoyl] glucosamine N-acyltransferase
MVTIREFLEYFKGSGLEINENQVDEELVIQAPKNIMEAGENHLTFLNRKFENELEKVLGATGSKLILVESGLLKAVIKTGLLKNVALIGSVNPKKDMIDAINHFFPLKEKVPYIDPTSVIHKSCRLGKNLRVGPNAVIEEDVIIGDGCIIDANTVIKKGTILGKNVRIKSCSVIGGNGFGYDKGDEESSYKFLPHFGKVIIEDDVDIGSNTCIDKGSLSDTIIRKGVKIDNLVHIAHNVDIGENTLVIACSMVAGSVIIGENSWIAPSASIRNGLQIGKNCTVGLGSVLTNDIADNSTVLGVPAVDIEDFKYLRKHQKEILKSKNDSGTK